MKIEDSKIHALDVQIVIKLINSGIDLCEERRSSLVINWVLSNWSNALDTVRVDESHIALSVRKLRLAERRIIQCFKPVVYEEIVIVWNDRIFAWTWTRRRFSPSNFTDINGVWNNVLILSWMAVEVNR